MIADIRHHLQAGPFEPFSIVASIGHRYRSASADHAGVHRALEKEGAKKNGAA